MKSKPPAVDPRPTMTPDIDIRPTVAKPSQGVSPRILAGIAVGAGILLFTVLEARRRDATPTTALPAAVSAQPFSEPPPYAPQLQPAPIASPPPFYPPPSSNPMPGLPQRLPPAGGYQPSYQPPPSYSSNMPPSAQGYYPPQPGTGTMPGTVIPNDPRRPTSTAAPADNTGARVTAGTFVNPATTVIQGTLISAVLETAFVSTGGGFARALVQRDIRSFDGSRILIPRGSRLIGEYGDKAERGQKRALIAWTRLIRPDGATINIGSPATDPIGRGGVRAKVDSHFFERFAGAILQSSLDVGVNLAARAGNSPVIVALPDSVQSASNLSTRGNDVVPTLSVAAGTSIGVFVAHDLDFTAVEAGQ